MKILFQGDSITDAYRQPKEHNPAFRLGNGYAFLVAARLAASFPEAGLEFINRGVSGNRVTSIQARWQEDAVALRPDWLSLLAGVNETIAVMKGRECLDLDLFRRTYCGLLDELRVANPAIRLVLMEPFVLEVGIVTPAWREHLTPRQQIVSEVAQEHGAIFVPLQDRFDRAAARTSPADWIWDGVHPSHAGFQLIADAWLEAVMPSLEEALKIDVLLSRP